MIWFQYLMTAIASVVVLYQTYQSFSTSLSTTRSPPIQPIATQVITIVRQQPPMVALIAPHEDFVLVPPASPLPDPERDQPDEQQKFVDTFESNSGAFLFECVDENGEAVICSDSYSTANDTGNPASWLRGWMMQHIMPVNPSLYHNLLVMSFGEWLAIAIPLSIILVNALTYSKAQKGRAEKDHQVEVQAQHHEECHAQAAETAAQNASQLAQMKEQLNVTKAQLAGDEKARDEESEKWEEQKKEFLARIQELEERPVGLQTEEHLQAQLEKCRATIRSQVAQISELEGHMSLEEEDAIRSDRCELRVKLLDCERQSKRISGELEELRSQADEAKVDADHLAQEHTTLKRDFKSLEASLQVKDHDLQTLRVENLATERQRDALEVEIRTLREKAEQADALQTQVDKLQKQISEAHQASTGPPRPHSMDSVSGLQDQKKNSSQGTNEAEGTTRLDTTSNSSTNAAVSEDKSSEVVAAPDSVTVVTESSGGAGGQPVEAISTQAGSEEASDQKRAAATDSTNEPNPERLPTAVEQIVKRKEPIEKVEPMENDVIVRKDSQTSQSQPARDDDAGDPLSRSTSGLMPANEERDDMSTLSEEVSTKSVIDELSSNAPGNTASTTVTPPSPAQSTSSAQTVVFAEPSVKGQVVKRSEVSEIAQGAEVDENFGATKTERLHTDGRDEQQSNPHPAAAEDIEDQKAAEEASEKKPKPAPKDIPEPNKFDDKKRKDDDDDDDDQAPGGNGGAVSSAAPASGSKKADSAAQKSRQPYVSDDQSGDEGAYQNEKASEAETQGSDITAVKDSPVKPVVDLEGPMLKPNDTKNGKTLTKDGPKEDSPCKNLGKYKVKQSPFNPFATAFVPGQVAATSQSELKTPEQEQPRVKFPQPSVTGIQEQPQTTPQPQLETPPSDRCYNIQEWNVMKQKYPHVAPGDLYKAFRAGRCLYCGADGHDDQSSGCPKRKQVSSAISALEQSSSQPETPITPSKGPPLKLNTGVIIPTRTPTTPSSARPASGSADQSGSSSSSVVRGYRGQSSLNSRGDSSAARSAGLKASRWADDESNERAEDKEGQRPVGQLRRLWESSSPSPSPVATLGHNQTPATAPRERPAVGSSTVNGARTQNDAAPRGGGSPGNRSDHSGHATGLKASRWANDNPTQAFRKEQGVRSGAKQGAHSQPSDAPRGGGSGGNRGNGSPHGTGVQASRWANTGPSQPAAAASHGDNGQGRRQDQNKTQIPKGGQAEGSVVGSDAPRGGESPASGGGSVNRGNGLRASRFASDGLSQWSGRGMGQSLVPSQPSREGQGGGNQTAQRGRGQGGSVSNTRAHQQRGGGDSGVAQNTLPRQQNPSPSPNPNPNPTPGHDRDGRSTGSVNSSGNGNSRQRPAQKFVNPLLAELQRKNEESRNEELRLSEERVRIELERAQKEDEEKEEKEDMKMGSEEEL